jgi:hypothetical protein
MGKIGRGSLCVDAFSHRRSIFHRGSVNFAEDFLDLRLEQPVSILSYS